MIILRSLKEKVSKFGGIFGGILKIFMLKYFDKTKSYFINVVDVHSANALSVKKRALCAFFYASKKNSVIYELLEKWHM